MAEEFTSEEQAALAPYFTNLHGPVFALVNLPEVVKGALFARYSRSPKSLRRLFLDEFLGPGGLDAAAHDPAHAAAGAGRAEQLFERVLRGVVCRLRRPARGRAAGMRGRVVRPGQRAQVWPHNGVPRAVNPLRSLRRPARRPLSLSCPCGAWRRASRALRRDARPV